MRAVDRGVSGLISLAILLAGTGVSTASAVAAAPAAGAGASISVPPLAYKMRKLKNGLTVYTIRDMSSPNVLTSLFYDVGSKNDPAGLSGFAHFFEHMLSRKTVNMPYDMINRLTEEVGGTRNAGTDYDFTNYWEMVPAPYLETMLWTHAERMARPVLDTEVFTREREKLYQEVRERVLGQPYGPPGVLANVVIPENAFDTTPYRRTNVGDLQQLDTASLQDALAFHDAYYGPSTATLVVAGNFDEAQLNRWVDKYFGAIPARARPASLNARYREAPRTAHRAIEAYGPNVPLPTVAMTWKIPTANHPDIAPLSVLNAILTRGNNSRLFRSLVEEKGLTTQVRPLFNAYEDAGAYSLYAPVAAGKKMEDLEAALATEFERARAAPVSAAELAEAKNELLAITLRQRETIDGRAFDLGVTVSRGGDPRAADRMLAQIQGVSAADVQRVARRYLAPQAQVTIRYFNESQKPAGKAVPSNPTPMPKFQSLPKSARTSNVPAPESRRQAPPPPGAAVPSTPPLLAQGTLPNGLGIVAAKTGEVPLASMSLVVRAGGAADPAGKAGLASLAATLVTKGTSTRNARQIAAALESLGATLGANADPDGIMLSVSAPAANLEAAGEILADIARNATFPEEEVERARARALNALSVSLKDPDALANLLVPPVLFGSAPYGSQINGTASSLKSLTSADFQHHYRTWWHPANATLVIAGGIEPAASTALARRLFGGWQGEGRPPQAPADPAGKPLPPRTIVVDMPTAQQAFVLAAARTLGRSDPDYYTLATANAVLGVGQTSRLFEEVRTRRGLSYTTGSGLSARRDDAPLIAWAPTKNETTAEAAEAVLAEFGRLGKEPLTRDLLDKRQAFMIGNYSRSAGISANFASILAGLVEQGLPPEEAMRYAERLQAVTPEAAGAVSGRLLSPDSVSLLIVGDASKFLDKLRALRPNVEVIKADQLDLDRIAPR